MVCWGRVASKGYKLDLEIFGRLWQLKLFGWRKGQIFFSSCWSKRNCASCDCCDCSWQLLVLERQWRRWMAWERTPWGWVWWKLMYKVSPGNVSTGACACLSCSVNAFCWTCWSNACTSVRCWKELTVSLIFLPSMELTFNLFVFFCTMAC